MRIVIKENYEQLSRYAAAKFITYLVKEERVNIAPTAGSTPKRMYELLTEFMQGNEQLLAQNVYYYQQDNFVSRQKPEIATLFPEIDEMFFKPNQIAEKRIKRLTLQSYELAHETIQREGGLDFVVMGVGADGHFAANLPGTPWDRRGYVMYLEGEEQQKWSTFFNAPELDAATCLGPEILMQGKEIMIIVSGKSKSSIVKQVVEGPLTVDVPASILRMHPNCTLVCDKDAASELASIK